MIQKENSVKINILKDFIKDREEYQANIQKNNDKVQEIDCYLEMLKGNDEENHKMFSPRNDERRNKKQISEYEEEKKQLENDNIIYNEKIDKINYYIDRLKNCLATEKSLSVLCIQETERQRIARDLHDTSLQNLAHLVHKIELSSLYIDEDPLKAKLELALVSKSLKTVIEEIRNIIFELRPMSFDDLGFKETLEKLLHDINQNNDIDITADIEEISYDNDMILLSIYRVVQECLTNAVKHSGGNKIYFSCRMIEKDICVIEIQDNGKGFTPEDVENKGEKHFGLSVIKERVEIMGGTIKINSKINEGTKIEIRIPLLE